MYYLRRIAGIIVSRKMLVAVAAVLLAVAIWWVGPLLTFGDLHPLEDVYIRVIAIILLLAALLFWLMQWPTGAVIVVSCCTILWCASPLLGLDERHPLASVWVRVVLISVTLFVYLGYCLYRLWQALRVDDTLLKRILRPFPDDDPQQSARGEIRTIGVIVSKALAHLKMLRGGPHGWRRLLVSGRYLYELPWYMMIGTPGSGKTTATLGSGLQFPLAEQMGAQATRGQRGTAHCDWWFTNDAVLIDTAGRYIEQDEQQSDTVTATNSAEWFALLGLLRKHRPRAPLNGAILTLSVDELISRTPAELTKLAATLRTRLGELRQQLGIRFPVYVLVTKLDLLPGFSEYFQALTAEARTQIWGFTLPFVDNDAHERESDLRERCRREIVLLETRVDAGLNNRLLEEYEIERRKQLYPLAQEFRSLSANLIDVLGMIFLDSKYDDTHLQSTLRGVYFTSAEQTAQLMPADRDSLIQRLRRKLGRMSSTALDARSDLSATGQRPYFLRNVFQQVIFQEANLVRPNRNWEVRFRMLDWTGHALVVGTLVWLVIALMASYDNNTRYLDAVAQKTQGLETFVKGVNENAQGVAISDMLERARELPQYGTLNLDSPGSAYRYGLYVAPAVRTAAQTTYVSLLRRVLLPQIVHRFEIVLDAQIDAQDADGAYRTLSSYLMLYDPAHFDAGAIRQWVRLNWDNSNDTTVRPEDIGKISSHLDVLFADGHPVSPLTPQNTALVRRARVFLGASPASKRLYERAMASMSSFAPENFTLERAAGVQGEAVFAMNAGTPFEHGVPGLYTYDGYHKVFSTRLPEFLAQAQDQDAWVMGSARSRSLTGVSNVHGLVGWPAGQPSLADDVRRRYLIDYGEIWQRFLGDIRPAFSSANAVAGQSVMDPDTLRVLAAPDSPLVQLARAVVHETSLSLGEGQRDKPLDDMARRALSARSGTARTVMKVTAGITPQESGPALEKQWVDNRFAALREVVTGKADSGGISATAAALPLASVMTLLNEQYMRLKVAENTLAAGSMPAALDGGSTLQIEAEKLPAPLKAVLSEVAGQASTRVGEQIGTLLATQINTGVALECRRAIEGRYPFAASSQEVDIEDFNRLFSAGGVLDTYFQKSLSSLVDTEVHPWRYRSPGPGMPPIHGPSLIPFEQAAAIREIFFREPEARRMAWTASAKVTTLDPEITELAVDIDGQGIRYAHGPVVPFPVHWPGPQGGTMAQITAYPRIRPETSTAVATGPWALFHLIERARVSEAASANRIATDFTLDGRHAVLEWQTGAQQNPLAVARLFRAFHCPGDQS
ncbi:type VI secretion system membrane subunit TssM [Paraburkholderia aspalathi]|uniref:type VI secretion system membrane subunit TssM n=1 Tax=Paraburkholderia aspalathi TaxID=1324617 RepID=UPI0038BBA4D4